MAKTPNQRAPRSLALLAALVACLLPGAASALDATTVEPATLERLTGGSPIVIVEENPGGGLKLVTGAVQIAAPVSIVWGVVTDYEAYPEWMPEVTEVTTELREDGTRDVRYELLFELSIIKRKMDYILRTTETPMSRIEWELVEGDFDKAIGGWQLVPAHDGRATLAWYSTFTNLKSMGRLVRGLLEEQPALEMAIQVSTAVTVVQELRERVENPSKPQPDSR